MVVTSIPLQVARYASGRQRARSMLEVTPVRRLLDQAIQSQTGQRGRVGTFSNRAPKPSAIVRCARTASLSFV
jgi:hypothetical protein